MRSELVGESGREAFLKPLLIAFAILATLFGQYLIGPPNIHSARTLVMLVECAVLLIWLTNNPDGLLWRSSRLFRVIAYVWIFTGFVGALLATHNGASALVGHLEWMGHLIFIVALCDFFQRGWLSTLDILKGTAIAGAGGCLFFIWKWYSLEDPVSYSWIWGVAPFLNIRHTAFLFLPAFLSAFCLFLGQPNKRSWFYFVSACLSLGVLLWAAGRASIAAACLGALFAVVYYTFIIREQKWRPLIALLIMGSLSLSASNLFEVNDPSLQHNWSVDLEDEAAAERFTSGRLSTWKSLIEDLSVKDWVIGQGVDNYKYVAGRVDSTVHPHSWPLQAFAAWGVIGLTVIGVSTLCVLWGLIRETIRSGVWEDEQRPFPILCVLASSLALSLFDGNFYHSWALLINVVFFAAAISFFLSSRALHGSDDSGDGRLSSGWLYVVCFMLVGTFYQLVNNVIVFGREYVEPKSWQAEWVLAIPFNTVFVDEWLDDWKTQSNEESIRLLKWLQAYSPSKFRYLILEAEFLAGAGYPEAAEQLYRRALDVAPQKAREKLIEVGPPTSANGNSSN